METKRMMLLLTVWISCSVAGQTGNKSGIVTYEAARRLEIKLEGHDIPEDMLPKEMKSVKQLLFTEDEAFFRGTENPETNEEAFRDATGGQNMVIRMKEPEVEIYSDLKNHINIELREFMTRMFQIEIPTDTAKWRLTGNRKKILNYECLEAELTGSLPKAIAWFAPEISVSCGPEGYCGLPGLILELDLGYGKTHFNATAIEFKDPGSITKPEHGKRITRSEFIKIMEEKMKEQEELGNGGGIWIRHGQ